MKTILEQFKWLVEYCGLKCEINYDIMQVCILYRTKTGWFGWGRKVSKDRNKILDELCDYVKEYKNSPSMYDVDIYKLIKIIHLLKKRISTEQLQAIVTSFENTSYEFIVGDTGRILLIDYAMNTTKKITFMELIDLSLKLRMEEAV